MLAIGVPPLRRRQLLCVELHRRPGKNTGCQLILTKLLLSLSNTVDNSRAGACERSITRIQNGIPETQPLNHSQEAILSRRIKVFGAAFTCSSLKAKTKSDIINCDITTTVRNVLI